MICNFFNKVRFLTNKLKLLIFMKKPFLHLHLSLLFLMGCVFLLPSCIEDKAEDAAHRLVVSKVDVELIQTGMLNTGSKASFDVLANRGYVITSDAEWLDVDKPTGKGRVSVTLEAKPNETAGERTGHLTVTSGKLSERVTVTQTLDPDPDDGNPVGYTYYSENFDWIAVYGGADCVGLGSQNGAKNIYSTGDALQKFGEAGLQDYNPVGKTMYACAGYFKMGATDKQTGIILPALKIGRKKASNVELTFETCPNIGGSGKADAVTVTVEIVEGLKVSATSFRVNKFGFADEERTPLTFTVTAAEAWTSTADGWLTLSPASGDAGETEVTLTVGENGTGALRSGEVKIVTAQTGLEETVSVSQNAKDNLFEDDGQQVGHVYYNEPFDWAIPFGMDDQVGLNGTKWTRLSVQKNDEIKAAWAKCGLTDFNPDANCLFIASDYLHMGGKNIQTGVILPAIGVKAGQSTDVELSMETCANIGGSGTPDGVTVTVEITAGPGTVNGDSEKLCEPMTPAPSWGWTPMSVKLYGITADTRIVIRSTQQGQNGYFRWFLDDIKMTKIAAE